MACAVRCRRLRHRQSVRYRSMGSSKKLEDVMQAVRVRVMAVLKAPTVTFCRSWAMHARVDVLHEPQPSIYNYTSSALVH
jgi:hypothetical protein